MRLIILRNPVKSVNKLRMILHRKRQWPEIAVELDHEHALGVSGQLHASVGGEIRGLRRFHGSLYRTTQFCFFG